MSVLAMLITDITKKNVSSVLVGFIWTKLIANIKLLFKDDQTSVARGENHYNPSQKTSRDYPISWQVGHTKTFAFSLCILDC